MLDASAVQPMQQFDLGLNLSTKKTRKREFLEQMQQVVPWKDLVAVIAPYAPEGAHRPTSISCGDAAAHSLYAAMVHTQ